MSSKDSVLAWATTCVATLYFLFEYGHLYRVCRILAPGFAATAMELPLSTKFIISAWSVLCLLIPGAAIAAVIGKEFFIKDKRHSLWLTAIIAILVLITINWIQTALLLPVETLVDKLSR